MTHTASTRIVITLDQPQIAPEMAHVVQRLASPAGSEVTLLRVLVPTAGDDASVRHDVGLVVDLGERRARAQLARARLIVHPAALTNRSVRAS